ncbi:MAG: exodeoxyribonuclease VII small subunit [Deltaproteobacteria bacterium]|nr:exodeoxyribonuclease VII small subunit [Deltaproteobacteria bacterium]MBW2051545.1 exodeoxyribonuclease VII small subunit [Deltaproteobacteria bacterium]MBW2140110.1 exodeoxyribonuclease VII small subunit [Deltaproteobacteria bacterium]MBW2322035.1 exodeoxyribonuclease VII small subunit [Deltaproteobacteria bacterium]
MAGKKEDELTFEKGLGRLEQLVEDLESEELNLDKSLSLFEEGIKLARNLNKKLDQVEQKLELLLKNDNGELVSDNFALSSDEEEDNGLGS